MNRTGLAALTEGAAPRGPASIRWKPSPKVNRMGRAAPRPATTNTLVAPCTIRVPSHGILGNLGSMVKLKTGKLQIRGERSGFKSPSPHQFLVRVFISLRAPFFRVTFL